MIVSCKSNNHNNIVKAVANLVGITLSNEIAAQFITPSGFDSNFTEWLNTKLEKELNYDLYTDDSELAKTIAKGLVDYYWHINPSVEHTTKEKLVDDTQQHYGYSDGFARSDGITHAAVELLTIFNDVQDRGLQVEGNKLSYYIMRLQDAWLDILFGTIATEQNLTKKNVQDLYDKEQDKTAWLDKMLGGDNKSIQNSNKFAVYQELFTSSDFSTTLPNGRLYNTRYFKEVLSTPILDSVRKELFNLVEDVNNDNIADASDDKSEDYSSFLKHVGSRIMNYFNSLKQITSPSQLDSYDTDNSFGIAFGMDAVACCNLIYSSVNCNNVFDMLADIRRISKQMPGFAAFAKLADDLNADLDFAAEFRTVFNKIKMSKSEVVVEDGDANVVDSNKNINKTHVMINEMFADLSSSVINNDYNTIKDNIFDLTDELKDAKTEDALKPIIEKTITLIRQAFPSLQSEAIRSYIVTNGGNTLKTKKANIGALLRNLYNSNDNVIISRRNYESMLMRVQAAKETNAEIAAEERKKNFTNSDKKINISAIFREGYLSQGHNSSVKGLVSMLAPYSVVSIDLNSRNIYGNNSSDIINNSHIGNLHSMMQLFTRDENEVLHNDVLLNWVTDKLKSSQYAYSSIFLEHRDESGNIINYGLVCDTGDGYALTSYADSLLHFSLFNGSSDMDDNTNVGYSKMTEGDYLPTSFMQTLNSKVRSYDDAQHIPFFVGNYFLRTPSDAPKQFDVRMPLYNTDGLFIPANINQLDSDVFDMVQTYCKVFTQWQDYIGSKYDIVNGFTPGNFIDLEKEDLVDYIFPHSDIKIRDISKITYLDKANNIGQVEFFDKTGRCFVLKGKIAERGDYTFLTNPEFEGIIGRNFVTKQEFKTVLNDSHALGENEHREDELYDLIGGYFQSQLLRGDVTIGDKTFKQAELQMDVNHPVYKLLHNNFKQELINAMSALHHYYQFDENGRVELQLDADGNLIPVERGNVNQKAGYNFYHMKGGEIYSVDDSGLATLKGNVFHSSKFKFGRIITDENGNEVVEDRNYMEELMSNDVFDQDKGKINLLYGFQSGTSLQAKIVDGKVVDVILTQEQEQAIAAKMAEFAQNYVAHVDRYVRAREDVISGVEVTADSVRKYAINQFIAHCAFDDLFDGDTKFYKDGRTVLKRSKQNQGSGTPYGITDIKRQKGVITDINDGSSFLNSGTIRQYIRTEKGKYVRDDNGVLQFENVTVQHILKSIGLDVKQRTGWRAITIANSKNSRNKTFDLLVDVLEKQSGLPRERALDIIYGPVVMKNGEVVKDKDGEPKRSGGFTDTKVNDAQSYITFEEWIRRIAARGQLQRYLPLIKKIQAFDPNNRGTYLTASEIKEFVQVQKNFYYDQIYDERYGMFVPRQIKNAEFVLIPQFIKGTQLENVYNMMKEAGIDQLNTVETSKASNETVLSLWDNDGNISEERYANFVNEAKTLLTEGAGAYTYWYENLYTQQETPQHMNEHNKAGIQFLKKIVDNVPETTIDEDGNVVKHPMQERKEEFFKVFVANIESSLHKLCDELKIPRDKNGNIILDAEGKIQGLTKKKLYDKLLDELMRTGLDHNLLAYCILDEFGQPRMTPIMNNVISKFESITQSVFNHAITRQELPGFHAAQVTNVGFKSIREQGYDKGISPRVTYDKKLKYHIDDEGNYTDYIEIMVPLSWLGIDLKKPYYRKFVNKETHEFDMNALLKELDEKGLTKIIGYRIPTEGKQSICNMKVVGLLDDSQGSTIIVPDEWVAQTGSDFDIDSVYTICYNTITRGSGEIQRVKYIKDRNAIDYVNYLKRETRSKEEIQDAALSNIYKAIKAERDKTIDALPDKFKAMVQRAIATANNSANTLGLEGKEKATYVLQTLNDFLSNKRDTFAAQKNPAYKKLAELTQNVVTINEDTLNYLKNGRTYSPTIQAAIEESTKASIDKLNAIAERNNLLSFEDFKKSENDAIANSREARDNRILEIAEEILGDPSSLEENLSRSNFDDIVRARNEAMSKTEEEFRSSYSPYDVIAQVKYQDDAMSGADLKALSVTLDNLCSVCNTVKPFMSLPIKVMYDENDRTSYAHASKAYDEDHCKQTDKGFYVIHDTYGWTKNNRNVVGKILTAYSSQTTALILDAIKEGNIPNVNTYSFGAFKTLVNCGVAYEAAIPFMMQPAVKSIVDNQKALNSVFGNAYGNPITMAVREVAAKLNIVEQANRLGEEIEGDVDTMSVMEIMDIVDMLYNEKLNKIFNVGDGKSISFVGSKVTTADIPLMVDKINKRIKGTGEFATESEDRLLFDLGNMMLFYKLNNIASRIGDIGRVLNPDKFGAKQTVYATRQVFDNIDRILYDREQIDNPDSIENKDKVSFVADKNGHVRLAKTRRTDVLYVGDKKHRMNILEAVYPGCAVPDGDVDAVMQSILENKDGRPSAYPSLYAMLRCASITSVAVAKEVFDTQRPRFVQLVNGLSSVYSDNKTIVDEPTYNDLQKYIINALYNRLAVIRRPVRVRNENGETKFYTTNSISDENEKRRIYGMNYIPSLMVMDKNGNYIPFEVKDINNPTEDEMRQFEQFSPAQKIEWIKTNFKTLGIFEYINVKLYNNDPRAGKKQNMQSIEFIEGNVNTNDIYKLFSRAFVNSNPMIVSAAVDIIKYAAQVEGFRMTKTGIMKIIDNDILINDLGDTGIGFRDRFQDEINAINNGKIFGTIESAEEIYENYLRSHPNAKGIRTVKLSRKKIKDTGLFYPDKGMYILHQPTRRNTTKENRAEFENNLMTLGIGYQSGFTGNYKSNKYVRFVFNGKNTLYKINDYGHTVILYPLGNLSSNEFSDRSINPAYNEDILSKPAYEQLIRDYFAARTLGKEKFKSDSIFINTTVAKYKKENPNADIEYTAPKGIDYLNIPARQFSLQQLANDEGGSWSTLVQNVLEHFSNPEETQPYYSYLQALGDYVLSIGGISKQELLDADGKAHKVYIRRLNLNINQQDKRDVADYKKRRGSFADYYLIQGHISVPLKSGRV